MLNTKKMCTTKQNAFVLVFNLEIFLHFAFIQRMYKSIRKIAFSILDSLTEQFRN